MHLTHQQLRTKQEILSKKFAEAGIKKTHQRFEIFHEALKSDTHPDADTIYKAVRKRVKSISLDTVYRTLSMLHDLGLIQRLGLARDRVRFDANLDAHHHFVCTRCGKTLDFYSSEFDNLKIPESAKDLGDVELARVEIQGICRTCSQSKISNRFVQRNKEEK